MFCTLFDFTIHGNMYSVALSILLVILWKTETSLPNKLEVLVIENWAK